MAPFDPTNFLHRTTAENSATTSSPSMMLPSSSPWTFFSYDDDVFISPRPQTMRATLPMATAYVNNGTDERVEGMVTPYAHAYAHAHPYAQARSSSYVPVASMSPGLSGPHFGMQYGAGSNSRLPIMSPSISFPLCGSPEQQDSSNSDGEMTRSLVTGLFFTNRAEAVRTCKGPDWRPVYPDDTIPTTDTERQPIIRRLVNALRNRTNNQDKVGSVYRSRWTQKDENGNAKEFYDERAMEKVCWDILDHAEKIHTRGPSYLAIHDPEFVKCVDKTKDWTFAKRINTIVEFMSAFKNRCDKMMKGGELPLYVAAAGDILAGSRANRIQNGRRDEWIASGRKACAAKQAKQAKDEDDNDLYGSGGFFNYPFGHAKNEDDGDLYGGASFFTYELGHAKDEDDNDFEGGGGFPAFSFDGTKQEKGNGYTKTGRKIRVEKQEKKKKKERKEKQDTKGKQKKQEKQETDDTFAGGLVPRATTSLGYAAMRKFGMTDAAIPAYVKAAARPIKKPANSLKRKSFDPVDETDLATNGGSDHKRACTST